MVKRFLFFLILLFFFLWIMVVEVKGVQVRDFFPETGSVVRTCMDSQLLSSSPVEYFALGETKMGFPVELSWLLAGILFIFIEFFIPGVIIVFFGAGAITVAFTTWIHLTPTLPLQILGFTISSVLYLLFLRRYFKRIFTGKERVEGEEVSFIVEVGKIVSVSEYIQPGEIGGKVRYHGTFWAARCDFPCTPGESVRIKGYDNLTLIVEKINKEEK